jgi:Holliday junction resolvase RusA-like endonuclease
MIELTLPWPPSVNNYKKVGAVIRTKNDKIYQKRVNTNETKTFYWNVYQAIKKIMPPEGFEFFHSETIALDVYIRLHPPYNRRYDVDNRLKVLLDSLTRCRVWADDSQIHRLLVEKCEMIENGQVIVKIQEFVKCT